jgi:MOSC domain-containing protein YiiM
LSAHGRVLAVCAGAGGIPKLPVASARLTRLGLEGDGHRFASHGGEARAVCIYSLADYRSLEALGVRTSGGGTFGENLLIEGLDFGALEAGDRLELRAPAQLERATPASSAPSSELVELEIHDVREPCKTLRSVDARFPGLMSGRSGFVCRVLREGTLVAGMSVAHVRGRAPDSP